MKGSYGYNEQVIKIIRGKQVEADYSKQDLIEYKNNPLIEALPPILTVEEIYKSIAQLPPYSDEERNLSENIRIHCILRLCDYVEPFTYHLDLERRISTMIRRGYVGRNPMLREYTTKINFLSSMKKLKNQDEREMQFKVLRKQWNSTAAGFALIGMSGIGKSTAVNRILFNYPQVITHTEYDNNQFIHTQIVWLKLDCPLDGSLKSLCKSFFKEVDSILGTRYFEKFGEYKSSLDTMLIHMSHITELHSIGALFIDEIQHLTKAKGGADLMLNFFVTLINTIGVPVVTIGTFKAFSVLQRDFRQARRASGYGEIIWDRMKRDKEWAWFLERMWKYQWTKNNCELTEEMKEIMYDETQGITDRAIKLYMLVQWRAITSKKETIAASLIRKVASEEMRMTRPMINALKNNDIKELAKYDDIRPPDILELFQNSKSEIQLQGEIQKLSALNKLINKESKETIGKDIIFWLIQGGIQAKTAEKATNDVLNKFGVMEDSSLLKKKAMEFAIAYDSKTIENNTKRIEKKKQKRDKSSALEIEHNNLRFLYETAINNKCRVYTILNQEGYVKDPLIEFYKER